MFCLLYGCCCVGCGVCFGSVLCGFVFAGVFVYIDLLYCWLVFYGASGALLVCVLVGFLVVRF